MCDTNIRSSCNFSLTTNETDQLATCKTVMENFETEADKCQENAVNCTCWKQIIQHSVMRMKDCNIGKYNQYKVRDFKTIEPNFSVQCISFLGEIDFDIHDPLQTDSRYNIVE